MTRSGPPLPGTPSSFPPEEAPTKPALLTGELAWCPDCHGGGRRAIWRYVRETCLLCDGAGFVPAALHAEVMRRRRESA